MLCAQGLLRQVVACFKAQGGSAVESVVFEVQVCRVPLVISSYQWQPAVILAHGETFTCVLHIASVRLRATILCHLHYRIVCKCLRY
jgi:hypothetical protein